MDKDLMSESPKVTVLMPVYNGEKYLREAIESILCQTYADFEFLIINDGSTDGSAEIIKSYNDPRIRLLHNERNLGIIATLNKGIDLAKGVYTARMDCDDISLSERLERQVSFMDKHPEIGACGTWVNMVGEDTSIWRYPTTNDEIRCRLLFESALAHPSVIIRNKSLRDNNLIYSVDYKHAEDYNLWVGLSQKSLLANMDEVLIKYRLHPHKVGAVYDREQLHAANGIRRNQLADLGMKLSDGDLALHSDISNFRYRDSEGYLSKVLDFLVKIEMVNDEKHIYDNASLHKELAYRWLVICYLAPIGPRKWIFWGRSPFRGSIFTLLRDRVRLLTK